MALQAVACDRGYGDPSGRCMGVPCTTAGSNPSVFRWVAAILPEGCVLPVVDFAGGHSVVHGEQGGEVPPVRAHDVAIHGDQVDFGAHLAAPNRVSGGLELVEKLQRQLFFMARFLSPRPPCSLC